MELTCPQCWRKYDLTQQERSILAACPMCVTKMKGEIAHYRVGFRPPAGSAVRICPVCDQAMRRIGRAVQGVLVVVDSCPDHGEWLDKGELEALVNAAFRAVLDRVSRGEPVGGTPTASPDDPEGS